MDLGELTPMKEEATGWGAYPKSAWEKDSFALVASDGQGNGCILETGGPAVAMEIEQVSALLGDLGLDDAPEGLNIWVGRLKTYTTETMESIYPEVENCLEGEFRALAPEEWDKLKAGKPLWDEKDWGGTDGCRTSS